MRRWSTAILDVIPPAVRVGVLGVFVGIALGLATAAATPLYVVAGLIGLDGQSVVLSDVRFGFIGFVAVATLLPFGVIPVPVGAVKLTLIDACLTAVLLIVFLRPLANPRIRFLSSGVDVPVLLFISVCLAAFVLGTAYQTTSADARLFMKLINSIIFFFSVVNGVRDLKTVERIMLAFVAGGAVAAIVGIILYFLPAHTSTHLLGSLAHIGYPDANILQYNPGTTVQRAIGTSIDPNILGATLMMCGSIAVGLYFLPRSRMYRLNLIASLGLMLAALLLTYSRGSLIGFVAGCAVVASLRYRRLWVIGGLIAIAVVLSPQLIQSSFVTHLESGIEVKDQAAAMRLGEYKDAMRLIVQYPWLGVGFGGAPDVNLYVGVSSIYLLLAEQVGLIGLAIWLWGVGSIAWKGLRFALQQYDEASTMVLAALAALISALVAGLFDHHFVDLHFPHVVAMVWMIAGLLIVGIRLGSIASPEPASDSNDSNELVQVAPLAGARGL